MYVGLSLRRFIGGFRQFAKAAVVAKCIIRGHNQGENLRIIKKTDYSTIQSVNKRSAVAILIKLENGLTISAAQSLHE
jgi:hypothetical protein